MALDSFHVDWDPEVEQSFYEDSHERNVVPDSPNKHFFTWNKISLNGRERANLPDEDEWRFERPMGIGSFGATSLFSKVNASQELTDVSVPTQNFCMRRLTIASFRHLY
jgi:hypothetical protein